MKYRDRWYSLAALLALVACDSKEKKVEKPAELTDIKSPTVRIQKLWGASVGGGGKKLRLGLGLATAGNQLFAAGRDGDVAAFDLKTRQTDSGARKPSSSLSGGTGVGSGVVAVGSADGQVVAIGADDGKERWRHEVKGEILSAPAVAENEVIVRTVDGKLRALSLADGAELWTAEQQIPRLTLRGTAAPVVAREIAISGFDNGRVLAVSLADGATVWDSPVSPSHGRTELERLNDIDAAVKVAGRRRIRRRLPGSRRHAGARLGPDLVDARRVQLSRSRRRRRADVRQSTSQGDVVALKRRSGVEVWRDESLKRRSLSAPAVVGDYVVVADLDGYVHWFDRATGSPAGRTKSGGDRVTNAPLSVDGNLYLINDEGEIVALHGSPVGEPAPRRVEPAPAAPPAPGG